ncbi:MAG: D-alanyl-D-alanine carboxypeptidase, partial [Ornithinimicrobium sp.]
MRRSWRRLGMLWCLVVLMVTGLLTAAAAAPADPTSTSQPSPRVAQDAVRPQLPRTVDFALEPAQRGQAPDVEIMRDRARPLWESRWMGSAALRSITVRDALSGEHLIDIGADTPLTPASTTKVLSAAAIMSVLPPDQTFLTQVVAGQQEGDIVLVAGGDQLLSAGRGRATAVAGRAGLQDLAVSTAEALTEQGITGPVRVGVDTSYADGPAVSPGWTDFWVENGFAGRIAMLAMEQDRALPYDPAPADPAMSAARTFRAALIEQGVEVAGGDSGDVERVEASPDATADPAAPTVLAQVESAPVRDVLALALTTSDNAMIEQLS